MQDKLKSRLSEKFGQLKLLRQNKTLFFVAGLSLVVFLLFVIFAKAEVYLNTSPTKSEKTNFGSKFNLQTLVPSPTPIPTPRPLTLAEMNALYGPCVRLPVVFYHYIQTEEAAKANKQTSLTVYTDIFKNQMQYLKDKGYNIATMQDLVNFFDNGEKIPAKSVLLTFDDGYSDFYTDAFPILKDLGFRATVFTPTGLLENPGYLTWNQVSQMGTSILFANHTWSHKNIGVNDATMKYEISTADNQLSERGLDNPKVFAYPYGLDSGQAEKYLASLEYKAAFTTKPGSILCKKQRFDLPRIRIGNAPLSNYGF